MFLSRFTRNRGRDREPPPPSAATLLTTASIPSSPSSTSLDDFLTNLTAGDTTPADAPPLTRRPRVPVFRLSADQSAMRHRSLDPYAAPPQPMRRRSTPVMRSASYMPLPLFSSRVSLPPTPVETAVEPEVPEEKTERKRDKFKAAGLKLAKSVKRLGRARTTVDRTRGEV